MLRYMVAYAVTVITVNHKIVLMSTPNAIKKKTVLKRLLTE